MESLVTASFYLLIKGVDKIYFHLVRQCFHQKKNHIFETLDSQICLKSTRIHPVRGRASGGKERLQLLMSFFFSEECSKCFGFFLKTGR